jgi:low affinity Fe/Cu permease
MELDLMSLNEAFTRISTTVAHAAGHATTFVLSIAIIMVWAVSGPLFQFSDTWQLIINTGTTIVTFLMVFLIQNTQNRDGAAIQAKLDELIRVTSASNTFIGIEYLTEQEVDEFREKCARKARAAGADVPDDEGRRTADKARKTADDDE